MPINRLRHYVSGAIERGEAEPIVAVIDPREQMSVGHMCFIGDYEYYSIRCESQTVVFRAATSHDVSANGRRPGQPFLSRELWQFQPLFRKLYDFDAQEKPRQCN